MRAFVLSESRIEETSSMPEARAAIAAGKKLWIDLGPREEGVDAMLLDDLRIHPLVVEDIWADRSIPKIDSFDEYLYIVAHGVALGSAPESLELWVLDLVVGDRFVVTQRREASSHADVRAIVDRLPQLLARGTPWVAHAILDSIVDRFLPLIDRIGARIERADEDVLHVAGKPEGASLDRTIFALKRSIQKMCRITSHQRAILERLARADFPSVPRDAVPYFRDVAEHFERVAEQAEVYRDMAAGAMDAYLSMQSHRLNQTMKTLTLMSTCMLPVTFIASVYGMNFRHMPETSWEYGYPFAIALMATVAATILFIFRRMRWL